MKEILAKLKTLTPPKMIREALALYGTTEDTSKKSNPIILAWAKETKTASDNWYNDDSIPWCGLFMAVVAQRAGKEVPPNCLRALAWDNFGIKVNEAVLGDVLTFTRNGGGHVALYVAESDDSYFVLGGNQSNKVNITRILKNRLHSIRRPIYSIGMPADCKPYYFTNKGEISTNEK
jgi:uncharacterized protein (TIGR02594 family)